MNLPEECSCTKTLKPESFFTIPEEACIEKTEEFWCSNYCEGTRVCLFKAIKNLIKKPKKLTKKEDKI